MTAERFKVRFDGAAAWSQLSPEAQLAIGAVALETVVNWNGQDAYHDRAEARPFDAADSLLLDRLHALVNDAIPTVIAAEPLPVPSLLGQVCRKCGCSDHDACIQICAWAEPNLCTSCFDPADVGG